MYTSDQLNIANTVLSLSGGRHTQLWVKNNASQVNTLIDATIHLPHSANMMERAYCILHNITEMQRCNSCPSCVKWDKSNRQYKKFCSRKCSAPNTTNIAKKTLQRKYGVDNPSLIAGVQQKKIDTCNRTHAVDFPQQHAVIRQKTFDTMQRKFGVNFPYENPQLLQDARETLYDNYGVANPSHSSIIQQRKIDTNYTKYNARHYNTATISHAIKQLESYEWMYDQHITKQKPLYIIGQELGCSDGTVGRYLHAHGLETQYYIQSTGEREVAEFISSLGIKTILNDRSIINPLELDIYLPSFNLAIEYCGLYWHSEQQGKDKHYHKTKYNKCKSLNIQLITLYEDEWINNKELIQEKLKHILKQNISSGVYARNTTVVPITSNVKKQFLDGYHIQGNGLSSIALGLEHNGTLVACMTFTKHSSYHTLTRYATSRPIIGGFSKLLKYFKTNYDWNQIISFADLRWSTGALYTKTGWILDKIIPPDYSYATSNTTRYHKFNYRRKYLPTKLKHFDPTLSERENCDNNGILRIWDCGKLRYIINNS